MSGRAHLRSFRGFFFAALLAGLALALPTAILWAGRSLTDPNDKHHKLAITENRAMHKLTWVTAGTRPKGLSPLGEDFQPYIPDDQHKKGRVETGLGWVDLKSRDLVQRVSADLRTPDSALRVRGPKGAMQEGLNILQIDKAALGRLGYDAIAKEIEADAKILGVAQDSALIVRAKGKDSLAALASHPYVVAFGPYEPAYKIARNIGNLKLIQRSRSESSTMDILVSLWQDAKPAEVEARLQALLGKGNAASFSIDGTVIKIKASTEQVKRVAQDPDVRDLEEQLEYNLTNSETPTVMMIGSYFDSFMGARPFHEIGVDGGGIDTNLDGQRINNDTDTVPPQIVAVTDNGITYDAVHFSQSLTVETDATHPIGPAHRKIQSVQTTGEDAAGLSCDAVLSGSTTHGNVVAGIIAGAPGDFGLTYTKSIDPQTMPPIHGIPLDALARGSRILFQDVAAVSRCVTTELIEVGGEVAPGPVADRLALAICPKANGTGACLNLVGGGSEVHLQVLPFGVPNFDNIVNNPENGTYTTDSAAIDKFLVNNRDYMVFSPVGNQGTIPNLFRPIWPDLMDGTTKDNDPNNPAKLQITPPATAKNSVTVGSTASDNWTVLGDFNAEEAGLDSSSKGPATFGSLRTAPLLMAVGTDGTGLFGYPLFAEAATNRSRDNDNTGDVENEIDDENSGTSFAAGFATAAGAIVRDYFAQGFYPTATRVAADRNLTVSGSLVRAALVAGSNFLEQAGTPADLGVPGRLVDERIFNARAIDADFVAGDFIGVIGNMVQGYGRIVLDQVLPLPNYPPTRGIGLPDTVEYPAAGLIVYDNLATGEPVINNAPINCATGAGCSEKTFTVMGVNTITSTIHVCSNNSAVSCTIDSTCGTGNTCVARQSNSIAAGQLRVALSWPDPPNTLPSEGTLINDLDLEVESPGPDNDITTTGDNILYVGNSYIDNKTGPAGGGQWSQGHLQGESFRRDIRNTIEAIHLSSVVASDDATNQLPTGTWKVRVKRGAGGAVAGQISMINGPDEDANHNGRLDPGEDLTPFNGLLDSGGQPFALVISGPVLGNGSQTWNLQSHAFPQSAVKLDKYQYSCSDSLQVQVLDAAATAQTASTKLSITVLNSLGQVVDQESALPFSAGVAGSGDFTSSLIPVRFASPGAKNNGIIEGDNGRTIVVSYAGTGRASEARARFQCTPNIIQAAISTPGMTDPFSFIGGGCDRDQYLDANERVTYSIALTNFETHDDLEDVTATLVPSGPGANAIRVLDSPKNFGRVPGGQKTGVTFSLFVDGTVVNALPINSRTVTLNLTLDGVARGVKTSRTAYSFTHVLNADKESLHYSTDFPGGGHQIRDYNRNLQIDKPDVIDPFKGVFFPDEDLVFQTLFLANGDAQGRITNTIGEDVNGNGSPDFPSEDYNLNGVLDGGILTAGHTAPSSTDLVPWNFDTNNGGWFPVRHPNSKGGATPPGIMWEWTRFGICGFQTAVTDSVDPATTWFQNNGAGIWHTGDGDPTTPALNATACDNAAYPSDSQTPPQEEFIYDILLSPVIDKVHQKPDARGFDYGVEFQRLGVNVELQTAGYSGGSIDIDTNIDSDERNCLLCSYFYQRFPDPYGIISFDRYATQIYYTTSAFRTFGPLKDPNGSFAANSKIDGDETGFTGIPTTLDAYHYKTRPMHLASPDLRPFPDPDTPAVCLPGNPSKVCSNALTTACTSNANCSGGGTCIPNPDADHCEVNTVAGPERNLDVVLVDYEDGFVYLSSGPGAVEPTGIYSPGPAANRWMIGIGYYVMEQPTNSPKTDYGLGLDDVVLEWDETHAVDETQFVPPHTPACSRAGDTGLGAGQPCATMAVDRLNLYECNETVEVTVDDPRRSAQSSVTVFGVTDTDNTPFSTGVVIARIPRKQFSIPAVAGSPGLFRGRITIGSNFDSPDVLNTTPSQDISMTLFYLDPECDGDRDGTLGELSFSNLDGDGVAEAIDNCPHTYNPLQEDADHDGVGDICDNCPNTANGPLAAVNPGDNQKDSDADGVGDACDLDDIDFDGVVNGFDLCPDVYNPLQALAGGGQKGLGCDRTNSDRDNDGFNDANDNCVRTYNPSQVDSDGDRIGDACDGDCVNPQKALLATGSCSRTSDIICVDNSVCPTTGLCSITRTKLCTVDANCPNGETCQNISQETCERFGINNLVCSGGSTPGKTCFVNGDCAGGGTCVPGTCSTLDDDLDRDGIADADDDCPTVYNPAIIAGTTRQADSDSDGLGDACDPAATLDDDNNGVPDDAITFTTNILCRKLALGKLTILATSVRDVNGDLDVFGDPGETVRMTLLLKNAGPQTLTGATLVLNTVDPDIACISKSTVQIPTLAPGAQLDTASLGTDFTSTNPPGPGQFEYVVSANAQTINPANPAHGDFGLTLTSNEVLGLSPKVNIVTLLDLNFPQVCSNALTTPCTSSAQCGGAACINPPKICTGNPTQICTVDADCGVNGPCVTAGPLYVIGPTGQPDGHIVEDFDTDRDGDGVETLAPQPFGTGGVKNDTIGVTVSTAPGGINLLAAVGCGGFLVPPIEQPPGCLIDPDNDMSWHIHCPAGTCPNDTRHITPLGKGGNQNHTFQGHNSLHWGAHFSPTNYISDTVKFREIAAFMTNPINLTPFPRPGDLELSFFHIAAMMDNNYYNLKPNQANDYGDVQIQVDQNIDPNVDNWGQWDKLVPFQNVYDHIPYIWSTFGTSPTYCDFTPVDAGNGSTGGYAPRGVREIMCFPSGIWSHCGNQIDRSTIYQCDGPGSPGTENNLWVQSKFSLSNYLGQRVRIRWIAEAWEFDDHNSSYAEVSSWATVTGDEGWWIDDIQITGAIRSSFTPPPDPGAPLVPNCPTSTCNASVPNTDHGFNVVLTVQDESGDGVVVAGEKITVSAANTTDPGGCSTLRNGSGALIGAGVQYKFFKDGVLSQDWSSNPTFIDNPSLDAQYSVQVRCSADPVNCLSAVTNSAAGRSIPTYPGDGTDINLLVSHNGGTNTTTLTWNSRPQPLLISGYDLFSGTINSAGDAGLSTLTGIACLGNHLNQPASLKVCSGGPTPGATCQFDGQCGTGGTCVPTTLSATQTGVTPALGKSVYYLAGHHPTTPGSQTALGKRGDGTLEPQVNACP
jgi:subtilase family protein/thrombospondin type 3 repeat protein